MTVVLAIVYAAVLLALFAYGVNGYLLVWGRRRWRAPTAEAPRAWPAVTVQIPVYNERDVVERVIRAAARLRYPGALELQILDDSDDDSGDIVARVLAELAPGGPPATHVRRPTRAGYKAGALANGLATARGDVLLVLDADFVPPDDFLLRAVPHLAPGVACVQGRWGHLDRGARALTRGQALGIDLHFTVEQRARAALGWPVVFNGSAGLWRREALAAAGGWSADTLTEDLDLSYRALLAGWRIVYVDAAVCPGELPANMAAFKAQQRRWARGSTETARKLLAPIWRSPWLGVGGKLQATLHLTHYAVHPLILVSAALALPVSLALPHGSWPWMFLPPLALATGGTLAMTLAAARSARLSARETARDAAAMMLLGTGLALSNTVAVWRGLWGRSGVFVRTPKGGRASSYQPPRDRLAIPELVAGGACLAAAAWLLGRGGFALAPFLILYAAGLARVGLASLEEES